MKKNYIFFSESVTDGHPDKICDQISDTIVDRFLQQDPFAYVDVESAISQNIVFIAAQFASTAVIDMPQVTREVISQAGYKANSEEAEKYTVLTSIREMPLDDTLRINELELDDRQLDRIKVRHMANAFGYACNHTAALMPYSIWLAHKLARRLNRARLTRALPGLQPDGKVQVGVEYQNGIPCRIHSISFQVCLGESGLDRTEADLQKEIMAAVIDPALYNEGIGFDNKTTIYIEVERGEANCGPMGHSGLSGRKTAIDTYGEAARHSASALSGKSPTRVDRIGTYMARYAAKNVVAAGLADECELQLSYSIGLSRPVSTQVETFGSGKIPDREISKLLEENFDFRPAGIMKTFRLRHMPKIMKGGFYRKLAAYGHIGRMDIGLPWEITEKAALLK